MNWFGGHEKSLTDKVSMPQKDKKYKHVFVQTLTNASGTIHVHLTRRHANHPMATGNIMNNHRTCTHKGMIADSDSLANDGSSANMHAFSNDDSSAKNRTRCNVGMSTDNTIVFDNGRTVDQNILG
jgi:hypothetical protein